MDLEKIANRGMFPGCDVVAVPPPPTGRALADFEAKYISDAYLHEGDPGYADRLERCVELQFARWEWARANLDTYVNMLRVKGHADQKIADMAVHGIPMSFADAAQYGRFKLALLHLRHALGDEANGLGDIGFVHTGSSVPGFSTNPLKGFADLPSRITAVGKSDIDLVFVATGIDAAATRLEAQGRSRWRYATTMADGTETFRYSTDHDDIAQVSPLTYAFIQRWQDELGAEIQVTLHERPAVDFAPWENAVRLI